MDTKKLLITAGVVVAGIVVYDLVTAPTEGNISGTVDGTTQSLGNSVSVGGSVLVGGGVAWLLLLLFP